MTISSKDEHYTYTGDTGHLIGIWSSLTTIFFSMQGFYTVTVTAAESKCIDRDESIKLATRKISLRVILLYCLLVFTVGPTSLTPTSTLRTRASPQSERVTTRRSSSKWCMPESLAGHISSMLSSSSRHSALPAMHCTPPHDSCMPWRTSATFGQRQVGHTPSSADWKKQRRKGCLWLPFVSPGALASSASSLHRQLQQRRWAACQPTAIAR